VQRFRDGLVFKAYRLGVSLNARLESNKEEKRIGPASPGDGGAGHVFAGGRYFFFFVITLKPRVE